MRYITVVNPPERGTRRKTMKTRKKRRASARQLAALRRGRALRRTKIARNPKRKIRRLKRRVRRSLRRKAPHKNPYIGELAMMNPRKKRKSSRRRRRSSRSLLPNPLGGALSSVVAGPKEMISAEFAKDAIAVAAGFLLPNQLVMRAPAAMRDARWKVYGTKVLAVAAVSGGVSVISKRASKMVLLGGGVSLLLDAYADFVAPKLAAAAAPAPAGGAAHYFGGDDGVGHWFGPDDGVGDLAGSAAADGGDDWY